jgi:hypothetical protein
VFAVDVLFWFVTAFTLLTLVCSAAFVTYYIGRKMFGALFPSSQTVRPMMRAAPWAVPATSAGANVIRGGIDALNAAAIAGPWGPIDRALSPEIAQKVTRIMALGVSMRDAAGNLCPHPIAPRVALAIVEDLQGQP